MTVANSFHGLMHKIGRYQVELELGRGAMGIVYRAFDPAIGRRIAIKTIRLDQLTGAAERNTLRQQLLREAQSAGVLSHPNIVTIYDISEDEHNAYIFMEYVEGATLNQMARSMPVPDLLQILTQAAEALDYAHARGIVHRDIKPGNLMLSGRQVKITDFGIARLAGRDSTQSTNLLGTPAYMSPEQIAGSPVTGAADQYALGVIAYEFLAGQKPFDSDNLANLLFRISHQPVPPVPHLNAAANQVLARVLSKNPDHRYPSCLAFASALSHAAQLDPPRHTLHRDSIEDEPTLIVSALPDPPPVSLPPLHRPVPPESANRRSLRWIALLAVAVIAPAVWYFYNTSLATPSFEPVLSSPAPPVLDSRPSPMPPAPVTTQPIENKDPDQSPAALAPSPAPAAKTNPIPPSEPLDDFYTVSFLSSPEGAEFVVSGPQSDRCPQSPCALELPPGDYRVTARLAGYPDVVRRLRVPAQLSIHLILEKPEGTLAVNSTPSGAAVRVNGRDTGQRTPALLKLPPGTYTVEVLKDGLTPQSREIQVRTGFVQTLSIQWN